MPLHVFAENQLLIDEEAMTLTDSTNHALEEEDLTHLETEESGVEEVGNSSEITAPEALISDTESVSEPQVEVGGETAPLEETTTLDISNTLAVVETNTAVGGSQRFTQSLAINGQASEVWENLQFITEVSVPYQDWLDTSSFTLPTIQSLEGVQSSWKWKDDTTLVIKYDAPRVYAGASMVIPIVLITGNTAGGNKKASVTSYITQGNTEERRFVSNTIELGATINTWEGTSVGIGSSDVEMIEGDGALTVSSYLNLTLNVPDTSFQNNQVIGQKFAINQLRIYMNQTTGADKMYYGDTTFAIQLPTGMGLVNKDSPHYDPENRMYSAVQEKMDLSNVNNASADFPDLQLDVSGMEAGRYQLPLVITAYNELDDASFVLFEGNINVTINKRPTESSLSQLLSGNSNYDTHYTRNNWLLTASARLSIQNTTLTNNWQWIIDTTKTDNDSHYVDSFIGRISLSLSTYSGSINLYYSKNGIDLDGVIIENATHGQLNTSRTLPEGYRYVIITPNDDFYQEHSFVSATNIATITPKLSSTEPIYSEETIGTPRTNVTSTFRLNGEDNISTRSIAINRPQNFASLSVVKVTDSNNGSNTQNVIMQDQTFTEQVGVVEQYVDYNGDDSKLVVLMPNGVTLERAFGISSLYNPDYQFIPNYQDTGKNALLFTHTPGLGHMPGSYISFQFKTSAYVQLGDLEVEYYYSFADSYYESTTGVRYSPSVLDTQDINDNGLITDNIAKTTSSRIFEKTKEIVGVVSAKHDTETNYSDSLITSDIYADSKTIDYMVEIRNYIEPSLTEAEVIVRIPKVGDRDFSDSAILLGNSKNTFLTSVTIPEEFDVYYTTENLNTTTSSEVGALTWTLYDATKLKEITGLKFVSKTGYSLETKEVERLYYSVEVENLKIGDTIDAQSIYGYGYTTDFGGTSGGRFVTEVKSSKIISALQSATFLIVSAKNQSISLAGTVQLINSRNQVVRTIDIAKDNVTQVTDLPAGSYKIRQIDFEEGYTSGQETFELVLEESETNNNHEVQLINYAAVASFELKDQIVYVGDAWDPEDNIQQVIDKEGNVLAKGEYLVTTTSEVDTSVPGISEVEISVNGLDSLSAKVTVIYGVVVHPEDQSEILESHPDEGDSMINKEIGTLKINYVTDLTFSGKYTANTGVSLFADTDKQWGELVDEVWTVKEIEPFINIEDRRETNSNYRLNAAMTTAFTTTEGRKLQGAQLIFTKGATTFGSSTTIRSAILLEEGSTELMVDSSEKGSNSLAFSNVELSLPEGRSYVAGEYQATINWNLSEGPA